MQLENGNLYCWQWDTKQRLIIEEIDESLNNYIYIGNPKDKVGLYKMEIYDESGILYCDIPDEILQFAGTANIYLSEVSADKINTTAFWRFTIKEREKPMDYVFYPTEQITIEMIMEELKKTQDMVDPNTIQKEIHNYFVENPLSEQELDPVATKAIEKHNVDSQAHKVLLANQLQIANNYTDQTCIQLKNDVQSIIEDTKNIVAVLDEDGLSISIEEILTHFDNGRSVYIATQAYGDLVILFAPYGMDSEGVIFSWVGPVDDSFGYALLYITFDGQILEMFEEISLKSDLQEGLDSIISSEQLLELESLLQEV